MTKLEAKKQESKQLTVVAAVVVELLLLQVNNVRADRVEEALVVRDDQQCLLPRLQVAETNQE